MELINRERRNAGLSRVDMGDNVAAQLHAESMLENCFTSHWGIDGLKPYMRYALEGGDQYSSENASGLDYCITAGDGYRGLVGIEEEVEDVMEGLMDSPGHRDNILAPLHRKVNIGLAWDRYNFFAVQLFEGDYVDYQQYPIIEGDILKISGSTKNGADLDYSGNTSSFSIYYDPPPHELTRGQVARTYCYGGGRPVAFLRKPLGSGFYYIDDEFTSTYSPCPDPYDVDSLAPPAASQEEAHDLWQAAYDASRESPEVSFTGQRITMSKWRVSPQRFSVEADLSQLLEEHGPGIYTITMWGIVDEEEGVISQYPIFHEIDPP